MADRTRTGPPESRRGRSSGNRQGGMSTPEREVPAADPFAGLPLLIPVPQAAKLIGISRAAAYRFASAGDGRVLSRLSSRVHEPCSLTEVVALRSQTGL